MKILTLHRRLEAKNGTALLVPYLTTGSEDVAKHFEQEELKFLQSLAQCHVVMDVPGKGAQLVMPVPTLIARLGIHGIFTVTITDETKDSTVMEIRRPNLIVPGKA